MKEGKWIGLGVLVALGILFVGLVGGWLLGRFSWRTPVLAAGHMPDATPYASCDGPGFGMGPGMMRRQSTDAFCTADTNVRPGMCADEDAGESCRFAATNAPTPGEGETLTIEEAQTALETYLADQEYNDLTIVDMMEFERNFYAIARETDTGIGAMELLVDKWSGAVSPEMGPNMMWNTKYGMHRRDMMGAWSSGENTLSAAEALEIAQTWLDENQPGVTVEEDADPFYGYYTIHTYSNDTIAGMLSVNRTTGQVWYHTWHGEFIQMLEEE
ncbi:MAG: hypothetical protein ACK2UI_10935 [Anaerolineae bacterium]